MINTARYRWLPCLLILGLLIVPSACSRYKTRGITRLVRKEWKELLPRARNGTGYISHTKGLYYKGILLDLLKFLELNQKRIYRGDQNQLLYDQAMIKLMAAEFIDSIKLFKTYMDVSGDDIRPWLHIGLRIGFEHHSLLPYFQNTAIDNAAENMKRFLTEDEVLHLVHYRSARFFEVMPEDKKSSTFHSVLP